jgi:hypothetical protein
VQRETHVGAAVVNGVNLSVVPKDGYGAIWTGYNDDTLMLQLLQRTDIYPHYLSDHCHLQHLPFANFCGLSNVHSQTLLHSLSTRHMGEIPVALQGFKIFVAQFVKLGDDVGILPFAHLHACTHKKPKPT